jgi:hypothetical protein
MQHVLSVYQYVHVRTLSLSGYRQREAEDVCGPLKGKKLSRNLEKDSGG